MFVASAKEGVAMSFWQGAISESFHDRVLFEIAVDNLEELFAGLDIGGCS
jgi:hypothetical protein